MLKKTAISILILITIAVAAMIFLNVNGDKSTRKRTLIISGADEIRKDALADSAENLHNSPISTLIFSPLVIPDKEEAFHYILADEIHAIGGRREWEMRLKGDVTFHDGSPLTAEDVVFSLKMTRKLVPEMRSRLEIKRISADGKYALSIELNPSTHSLHRLLDFYVMPKNTVNSEEKWPGNLIGSGPFMFNRWLDDGIELVANERYFEGRPFLDKVFYRWEKDEKKRLSLLLKEEVDALSPVSPEVAGFLMKDGRFHVNRLSLPYQITLFLNCKSGVFRDIRIRQAVNMSLDRRAIVEKGLSAGSLAAMPSRPDAPAGTHDPGRSSKLLMDAGWKDNNRKGVLEKDGKELAFRLFYIEEIKDFKRVSAVIQQELYEQGIRMETIPVRFDDFINRNFPKGDYDAFLTPIMAITSLETLTSLYEKYNFSNYENEEIKQLIRKVMENVGDEEERQLINRKIEEMVYNDATSVPLYRPLSYSAVNRKFKGAEGFFGIPYSFYRIKDWSVNEDSR